MTTQWTRQFTAGWGDMDFNGHMRNTAYLDYSGTVRMMFFKEAGFSADEFRERRLGPVIFEDRVSYLKEISLLEKFSVRLLVDGLRPDGSRFRVVNEFHTDSGKAAVVTSIGGWLDLRERKLVVPPPGLIRAMESMEKTSQFQEI